MEISRIGREGRMQNVLKAALGRYMRDDEIALEVDRLQYRGYLPHAPVRDPPLLFGGHPMRIQAAPAPRWCVPRNGGWSGEAGACHETVDLVLGYARVVLGPLDPVVDLGLNR